MAPRRNIAKPSVSLRRKLNQVVAVTAVLMLGATACSSSGTDKDAANSATGQSSAEAAPNSATGQDSPDADASNTGSTDAPSAATDAKSGGKISYAIAEPEALSPPAACYEKACDSVLKVLYTPLIDVDPDTGSTIYRQAESLETTDSITWTLTLKQGWKFQNGEPVDADAYIRAWNYGAYGPNAARGGSMFVQIAGYDAMNSDPPTAKTLSGVKKLGDYKIQLTMSAPFNQWPSIMSSWVFLPMTKECEADVAKCNESPIGDGPYKISEPWSHNQSVALTKWDGYTGDNAGNADEIEFKIYPDAGVAYEDLLSGQVDIINPTADQIVASANQPDIKQLQEANSGYQGLTFPLNKPEYTDVRVRKAISMAIDRKAITDSIAQNRVPADDIISRIVPGYEEGACAACVFDPEKAKSLLAEAGGFKGGTIKLSFASGKGYDEEMQAIGNQIQKNLGIPYKLDPLTSGEAFSKDRLNPSLWNWHMDYLSPENYLRPQFIGSKKSTWDPPEFNKAMEQGDQAPTAEDGLKYYREAADMVLKDMPTTPLFFEKQYFLYGPHVTNITLYNDKNNVDLLKVSVQD